MAQPANAPPQSVTPNTPDLAAGVGAFVSNLKADVASKTPQELVRRYVWHLVGLAVLLFVMVRLASTLVTLAALGALVSLVVGLKNPEKFCFLFGAKTSKSTVGWTFGVLFFLLVTVLPSLDGRQEGVAPVAAPASGVAPVSAPPAATSVPVKKTAAQMRADAAKERAARARAKAQRELAEKVAEKKQAERDAAMMAQAKVEADSANAPNLDAPGLDKPGLGAPKVDFLGTHAIQASVVLQDAGLVVTNQDTFAYRQVSVILNDTGIFGGFTFETSQIAPGERVEIPFGDFVTKKDARRFVPSQYKLKRVLLRCKTDYGIGIGSWPLN